MFIFTRILLHVLCMLYKIILFCNYCWLGCGIKSYSLNITYIDYSSPRSVSALTSSIQSPDTSCALQNKLCKQQSNNLFPNRCIYYDIQCIIAYYFYQQTETKYMMNTIKVDQMCWGLAVAVRHNSFNYKNGK